MSSTQTIRSGTVWRGLTNDKETFWSSSRASTQNKRTDHHKEAGLFSNTAKNKLYMVMYDHEKMLQLLLGRIEGFPALQRIQQYGFVNGFKRPGGAVKLAKHIGNWLK